MLALCGVGGPGALGAPAEVHVPATATCVSTGLFVRAGDTLTLTAAGEWTMWRGTYPRVGAEGHSFKAGPLGGWGRLCARIGTGPEVAVPLKQRWTADRTGPLFLFANAGNYGRDKAEGELDVQVEGGIPLADYLSQARAHGTEITVPASASCVDTGVFLQAGEAFTIDAVGTWTMATDNANYTTDAEGAPLVRFRDRRLGQLLCRIGGVPGPAQTPLGMHAEMRAPTSGILYLSPNSLWWLGTRNQGTLSVIIQGGQKASASLRTREKSAELDALRERILARCNELRARMGLPPVQRLASLERAAQGHAEYLDRNNVRGHVQEAGQPGFTGKSAGERLRAAGYDGAGGEVVAYEETAEQGFDLWVASVYHRQFATHPALQSIGLGVCGRVQVIDYAIASSPRTHAVACPPAAPRTFRSPGTGWSRPARCRPALPFRWAIPSARTSPTPSAR